MTAILMIAFATSACRSSRAAAPSPPSVALVGDSLAVLGADQITAELDEAGWRVKIDAYSGVTTDDQRGELEKAADASSDAVVVELGTNDALAIAAGRLAVAEARDHIRSTLELLDGRCVVWVNADADPTRPGGEGGGAFDEALKAEVASRPEVHIADLAAMLTAHPEYLLADDVHLTDEGSTALGALIASRVTACR